MAQEPKIEAIQHSPDLMEKAIKNKWTLVGIVGCVGIVLAVMLTKPEEATREVKAPPKTVTSLLPGDARQSDWIANAQTELRDAREKLELMSRENETLKREILQSREQQEEFRREINESIRGMGRARAIEDDTPSPALADSAPVETLPEDIVPPPRPADIKDEPIPMNPIPGASGPVRVGDVGEGPSPVVPQGPAPRQAPVILKGAELKTSNADGKARDALGREVTEQVKKNPFRGYLPAGSFADMALLSGADVGTAEFTRANPQPFLMRIQSQATTAGNGRYQMKSCFVMGEGFGELSSERVFVRATRLICMDHDNKLVLEQEIKGYVVDSDGSQGLRGEVVRRNGQLIAKALLAGFAEGIAEVGRAASEANAQAITTPFNSGGLTTARTRIDVGRLGEAGAFGGAANAASQLAELYIAEAKSMFPVIRVPSGRKGTLVIQEGRSLEWKTYEGLYVVEKVPVNSRTR